MSTCSILGKGPVRLSRIAVRELWRDPRRRHSPEPARAAVTDKEGGCADLGRNKDCGSADGQPVDGLVLGRRHQAHYEQWWCFSH